MTRTRATVLGGGAILLWSSLAALSLGTAPVPPFQLNALTFSLGALVGFGWMAVGGGRPRLRGLGWPVWVLGIGGLFLYHALYFTALRLAPAAEAGLIAYLWPLLIVLFSSLLPGERLHAAHLVGAALAMAGTVVLLGGGGGDGAAAGYAAAFACALVWAGYSVLSRLAGHAPTETVAVFCLGTAVLSLPAHLAVETTAWPATSAGWLAVLALGLGPVGLAFYLWDVGMKRGDIQLLGVVSYAAPLVSTILLVLTGLGQATPALALAAVLIVAGAGVAAWGSARR